MRNAQVNTINKQHHTSTLPYKHLYVHIQPYDSHRSRDDEYMNSVLFSHGNTYAVDTRTAYVLVQSLTLASILIFGTSAVWLDGGIFIPVWFTISPALIAQVTTDNYNDCCTCQLMSLESTE